MLGRPLEAERLFRQSIAISSADATERHVSPMLLNNLARTLRELHRLREAAHYARRCYQDAVTTDQQIAVNQALFVLAAAQRDQGALDRAAAHAGRAGGAVRADAPAGRPPVRILGVERSLLAAARGDLAAALSEADEAVAMAEASRQQPQYLRRVLRNRSEVNLLAARADRAAADAERAVQLELQAAEPGSLSSTVGLAYLALGRALQAQGRTQDAQGALLSAARHLRPTLGERHRATRDAGHRVSALTPPPLR